MSEDQFNRHTKTIVYDLLQDYFDRRMMLVSWDMNRLT